MNSRQALPTSPPPPLSVFLLGLVPVISKRPEPEDPPLKISFFVSSSKGSVAICLLRSSVSARTLGIVSHLSLSAEHLIGASGSVS
ncbi:hypothetical protein MLD38_031510 [Melastoma candidum]|uniref:Uncharacterized protein n=1 Tax=Melastoma candidum TaxID=119954 RepID=A0ACB9MPI3_9MYRT|nr:hypothetical protein MLD38_031510 [Melastoma candidum]